MSKFRIVANGRTAPESDSVTPQEKARDARVQARIQEARVRFLEDGHTVEELEERELFARLAPLDLQEYFYSDCSMGWDWSETFNVCTAGHRLIIDEHGEGSSESKAAARYARLNQRSRPMQPPMLDAIVRLAKPDFVNDEEWQLSAERQVMETHLPNALARIENQIAERDTALVGT